MSKTPINNEPINKSKKKQIFKTEVPTHILWDFLQNNFEDKDTHFIINKFSYKKTIYIKTLDTFIESVKVYYSKSKMKYVERNMNYNYFLTIIRQLCNANNITYVSKLIYDKSTYEIEYYIYKITLPTCNVNT